MLTSYRVKKIKGKPRIGSTISGKANILVLFKLASYNNINVAPSITNNSLHTTNIINAGLPMSTQRLKLTVK